MGNGDLGSRIFAQAYRFKGARSLKLKAVTRQAKGSYSPAPPVLAAVVTGRAGFAVASCAIRVPIGGLA